MQTLPHFIRSALSRERNDCLLERNDRGEWTSLSSRQALTRIESLACGLRDLDLGAGDRVALLSPNCVDWLISDFAILLAGCVVVPIFPTQALDQVQYILEDSQAKVLLIHSRAALKRLEPIGRALPQTFVFAEGGDASLLALEQRGERAKASHPELPAQYEGSISPEDLAVLIYTSGTTGTPKGVMLTHDNLAFTTESSFDYAFAAVKRGDAVLSVLPFSHIYEHMIAHGYIRTGVRYHICHRAEALLADLRDVRPVVITLVPRILERMVAAVAERALAQGGLKAKLVPWALRVGRDYMHSKSFGRRPSPAITAQYMLARPLVLKKVRPMLGLGSVKFLVSGSAPLHPDTAMTLLALGIAVLEGYGPTECSPVVSVNRLEDNDYGTVGKPIPGVQVKLTPDGEIMVKGRNVMRGYYRNEGASAAVMEDGWYKTGDVGTADARGYLRITDRKRELFKTSGGKFIAPARVESAIKRSIYINQVMLVGESQPHPAALISPNFDLVRAHLGIGPDIAAEELANREDVRAFIAQEVREHTRDLATFEQVRRVGILPRELSVEGGELSPTLKVKRRVVEQTFAAEIAQMYARQM